MCDKGLAPKWYIVNKTIFMVLAGKSDAQWDRLPEMGATDLVIGPVEF